MSTLNDNIATQQQLIYLFDTRDRITVQKYNLLEKLEHLSYKAREKKKEQKVSGKIYDLEFDEMETNNDIVNETLANTRIMESDIIEQYKTNDIPESFLFD